MSDASAPKRLIEDALIAAARALTSRLDVQGVATVLLDAVHDVFGARSSWVLLYDRRDQLLKTLAVTGPDAEAFRGVSMPADAGIMGLAFSNRRVVFVADARADDRWFDVARVHRTGLRSVFAVPLIGHDEVLGVVGLDGFSAHAPPEDRDIARLEALAAQAGIAIANAQMYEASERDRRRLSALLEERRGLRRRVAHLEEEVRAVSPHAEAIGESARWAETVQLADVVAEGSTTVLLLGETGTGKEVLARRIHDRSPRVLGPFVAVNCAALPETLVESELFGHEKGAFTNAVARKPGKFELAHGGTLFLDEVGDLPAGAQAKLLRVVQESKVERIGGTAPVPIDVRLIAATNRDLEQAIADGRFRSDLYFRLSVFPIELPALRERREDIAGLAGHFLAFHARRLGRGATRFSSAALARLQAYDWPGNVRELQNVIERAVILTRDDAEVPERAISLPRPRPGTGGRQRSDEVSTLAAADRRAILAALDASEWKISGRQGAAERLGLRPTTLHAKMKKLGIRRPERTDTSK